MERIGIVGRGAVGSALAGRLAECGPGVEAFVSGRDTAGLATLPPALDGLFLCVPDDAVADVAGVLAGLEREWGGVVVAHTSGALASDVLAPLAARGAEPLSFHPVQSFPPEAAPGAFDGICVGVEGSERAVAAGKALARRLGARPVVLGAAGKVYVHLAAAVASNFLVTLTSVAGEVLGAVGIDRREAAGLLGPLVEETWRNLRARPPEEALTGPVARGDVETVRRHLDALGRETPHLLPVYARLSLETVRLAERGGRLGPEAARLLRALLASALEASEE